MHWVLVGLLILFMLFDVYYHWLMKSKYKDILYMLSILVFGASTLVVTFFLDKCPFCYVMVILNVLVIFFKTTLYFVAAYCKSKESLNEKANEK